MRPSGLSNTTAEPATDSSPAISGRSSVPGTNPSACAASGAAISTSASSSRRIRRRVDSTLPLGTVKCRATRLHDPFDAGPTIATRTTFAFAIVDGEVALEIAELARGADVIAQARAADRDRMIEHALDRLRQARGAFALYRPRQALGRQPGPVEAFAGVDVADADDHALIEQRRFDRRLLAGEQSRQRRAVEIRRQRFGSEMAE